MSMETLKALSYQECRHLHALMSDPVACTIEALRQSYHRLFALFDLLSLVVSEERAEALLVFTYRDTFPEPREKGAQHA